MQKLVEALKRREREEAAKPKETAETFRAKFAEIYGPGKPHGSDENGPTGARSENPTEEPSADSGTPTAADLSGFEPIPDNAEVPGGENRTKNAKRTAKRTAKGGRRGANGKRRGVK